MLKSKDKTFKGKELVLKNTSLEKARRVIFHIPAKAKCLDCEQPFELEAVYDACPHCGSYFRDILQGKELKIRSLVLNQEIEHKPLNI